uniref:Uncharacterized protein n=2 Tax=Strongyloides papillosus TaxID=174720 RepID=A0A0N5BV50_STREA
MLVFKTIILVIVIFTPKIIETNILYKTYEVGILGIPLCKKVATGFVVVYLSEKPHIQKEWKPIARTVIEYGRQFVLIRKVKSLKKRPSK